jgi:hypothetical protein
MTIMVMVDGVITPLALVSTSMITVGTTGVMADIMDGVGMTLGCGITGATEDSMDGAGITGVGTIGAMVSAGVVIITRGTHHIMDMGMAYMETDITIVIMVATFTTGIMAIEVMPITEAEEVITIPIPWPTIAQSGH